MTASRNKRLKHDLKVPIIIFCIGEDAEKYASLALQNTRRMICKVLITSRAEITSRLIKAYRAQLQISRNIIIPVLMAEDNTIYEIVYDNNAKVIQNFDFILYNTAC